MTSKYETMRMDPANWKLGMIYVCGDDPRVVVRQRHLFGWTWNFGNPWVVPAIVIAVLLSIGPPYLAWASGIRSGPVLFGLLTVGILITIGIVSRLARDPGA